MLGSQELSSRTLSGIEEVPPNYLALCGARLVHQTPLRGSSPSMLVPTTCSFKVPSTWIANEETFSTSVGIKTTLGSIPPYLFKTGLAPRPQVAVLLHSICKKWIIYKLVVSPGTIDYSTTFFIKKSTRESLCFSSSYWISNPHFGLRGVAKLEHEQSGNHTR